MSLQVFVVEDDIGLQKLFDYALRRVDCHLVFASRGDEALAYLDHHTPHIIFLDVRLPSVSGEQVLDYLHQDARFRDVRVIVMSATQHYADLPNVREFILKPIMPQRIVQIVEDMRAGCP